MPPMSTRGLGRPRAASSRQNAVWGKCCGGMPLVPQTGQAARRGVVLAVRRLHHAAAEASQGRVPWKTFIGSSSAQKKTTYAGATADNCTVFG